MPNAWLGFAILATFHPSGRGIDDICSVEKQTLEQDFKKVNITINFKGEKLSMKSVMIRLFLVEKRTCFTPFSMVIRRLLSVVA